MSTDTKRDTFRSQVWILVGLTGSTVGVLSLGDGRLAYTAHGAGALAARHGRKLAALCRQPDLFRRLEDGEPVRILDEPLEALRFSFPWYNFGGGMKVAREDASFRFSFLRPANTMDQRVAGLTAAESILEGRAAGRRWRQLLAPEPRASD